MIDLEKETWRQYRNTPYEVSDFGRVRSYRRRGPTGGFNPYPTMMTPTIRRYEYTSVQITVDGRSYNENIHRLVCETFHGLPPAGKDQVRHLDGRPPNNRASNLCWGTVDEQIEDRRRHGTLGPRRTRTVTDLAAKVRVRIAAVGRHPAAILNQSQVREIRRRRACGESGAALAREYGVNEVTVCNIHKRKSWAWLADRDELEAGKLRLAAGVIEN